MNTNLPIYQQLSDLLRDKILDGGYTFGDTLPSERYLADKYGISHLTVRRALSVLQEEGLVLRQQGKGTFVCAPKMTMNMQVIEGFSSFLQNRGVAVTNEVLYSGLRPAKHKYAKIFDIPENEEVFECVRLRYGDGIPLAIEYNAVPRRYAPDIAKYDFKIYSLYNIYNSYNICIVEEKQSLEVVKILNPQAKLLNLDESSDVFLLTSTSTDANGNVVESTRIYNSDERIVFFASSTGDKELEK